MVAYGVPRAVDNGLLQEHSQCARNPVDSLILFHAVFTGKRATNGDAALPRGVFWLVKKIMKSNSGLLDYSRATPEFVAAEALAFDGRAYIWPPW